MDYNEIARIAYELYLQRRGLPGDPVHDWLTAERIYRERLSQMLPATGPVGLAAETTESPKKEVKATAVVTPEKKAKPRATVRKKAAPAVEEPKIENTTKKASAVKATTAKPAEEPKVRKVIRKKANS